MHYAFHDTEEQRLFLTGIISNVLLNSRNFAWGQKKTPMYWLNRMSCDNVEVVNEGLECGIGLSDYKDIKEGDTIEILGEVEV